MLPVNPVLKKAYNFCHPEAPLEAGDDRYVDFAALHVRGSDGDLMENVFHRLAMSDAPTRVLVTGFRGAGKTTELLRLAGRIQASGVEVVMIDAEDYLNLRMPATVSDLWLAIAGGFDKYLLDHPSTGASIGRAWDRIAAFLGREVELSPFKVQMGGAELQVSLKDNADFRKKLNAALEERRPKLVEECHRFVEEAIAVIKGATGRPTMFILDSFEKLQGTSATETEVIRVAETLFTRDWPLLQTPCNAILTVPPWLPFLEAGANVQLGGIHVLPMCKVTERDGLRCEAGERALLDLLDRRIGLAAIFGDGDLLLPLTRASGGYPRDLLRLAQEVLLRNAVAESLPLPPEKTRADVERVQSQYAESFRWALDGESLPLLAIVALDKDTEGLPRKDALHVARLFDHHFVMSYQNGERWLDLHPLIASQDSVLKAIEAERARRAAPPPPPPSA